MADTASMDETLSQARAICSKLAGDTQRAIMLREMHARAGYEADVVDAFGTSRASWGFNCVVAAIYFEFVMTVMRIHDDIGRNATASLSKLMDLISRNEFREALLLEKNQRLTDTREYASESAHIAASRARLVHRRIEKNYCFSLMTLEHARAEWEKLKGCALRSSLLGLRHKVLAHSALDQNGLKGLRKARFGDADRILDMTTRVVELVSIAVTRHQPNFDDDVAGWRTKADEFWRHAAHLHQDGPGESSKPGDHDAEGTSQG